MNKYAFLARTGNEIGFSLTIRADDGSTMLETGVDYIHQAFQTLIDWSIDDVSQDACATISGPNGFYATHRIKASRDFGWIESGEAISEVSAQPRSLAASEKPPGVGECDC
jgi:hypothetical protein